MLFPSIFWAISQAVCLFLLFRSACSCCKLIPPSSGAQDRIRLLSREITRPNVNKGGETQMLTDELSSCVKVSQVIFFGNF